MPDITYESSHNTSIVNLIREFSQVKEDEIRRLYLDQRTALEGDATVKDFLPVLAYRRARQILLAQYSEAID